MSVVRRTRDAVVEAVLAGAAVAAYEGARLAVEAGSAAIAPIVAGVAALATVAAALALRTALAALLHAPPLRAWSEDLAAGGAPRVAAATRAALAFAAAAGFTFGVYRVAAWMHVQFRFHEAGAIGLVIALVALVLGGLAVLAALALDRGMRARLPDHLFDGRRIWVLAGLAAALVLLVPTAVVARAIPALTLEYATTLSVLVLAVLAARVVRIGRHRAAWLAVIPVAAGAMLGTWSLADSPRARTAIVAYGVASAPVARFVRTLADRDGDGYAGVSVGGADCDDADPRRHPVAIDIPGNGIDENCTGADADVLAYGLRTQTRPVPPVMVRPNIVVISIDALRADHLGSYGYPRATSPVLDALAASGVRFAYAYTACPSTRCAIPALHTGRYASAIPRGPEGDAVPSLARVLRDAGWTTAAITCCERFAHARGELAGFTTIDASADTVRMQRAGQSNADVVIDHALDWLAGIDSAHPYFLWIHLYEPHFPYEAPDGPVFGDDAVARYDREIAYADAQIGRLLAALSPSTVVVVTADHGEELGEHGLRFHARSLYNQVVRIPLIVRLPGAAARVVDTPVSLVDVMPTLLDLAGVEGPFGMNGRSLVPALRGKAAPTRPVLVELIRDHQIERDMAAVIAPPWKVVWDREADAWSLYALDDLDDAHDRADAPVLPELQRLLRETLDRELGALP